MNKKILSLAVAAAMAAPLAAQADVTMYGQVQMSVDSYESHTADDYNTWPQGSLWSSPSPSNCGFFGIVPAIVCGSMPPALSFTGPLGRTWANRAYASTDTWRVMSNASRLGVKGSEDLGNGLSAIWGFEWQVDADGDTGDWTRRNMFAGLSHEQFGTVLAGRHDHPYKVMFNQFEKFAETPADDDLVMTGATPTNGLFAGQDTAGFADRRANNAIAYISPTMAGITFAGATVLADADTTNATGNEGVFSDQAGYSLAASGAWGPIKGALGYEALNNLDVNGTMAPLYLNDTYRDDDTLWGAGIAYDSAPFYVGLRYEDRSGVNYVKDYDMEQMRLTATYSFGNNTVKAMYHWLDGETPNFAWGGDYEGDAWAIGIDHNFSKRTMLYALYSVTDWSIDSNTGLGRWNGVPLQGTPGVGGAINSLALGAGFTGIGATTGQPVLMDTEVFSIGMLHKF